MNKAFTLVELLAVIIILGIVVGISYPIVNNVILNSKEKAYLETKNNIISSMKKYALEHDLGTYQAISRIDVSKLQNEGLLESNIINPLTDNPINGCITYYWDKDFNNYKFDYLEDCEASSLIDTLLVQYNGNKSNEAKNGLVEDVNDSNRYFYRGTNDEVTNNFLWYGGYEWRVIEFNKKNRTLKLISQKPITIINYKNNWNDSNSYKETVINKWLNDETDDSIYNGVFYNSFKENIKNNILMTNFKIGPNDNVDSITIDRKVGLLNALEYENAGGIDSYLDIKTYWWLGSKIQSGVAVVRNNGYVSSCSPDSFYAVRPVITISDINIRDGNGSLENNYKIRESVSNTKDVNIGDYIKVPYKGKECGKDGACLFRVINKDNDSIKIILNGLLKTTSKWSDNEKNETINLDDIIYKDVLIPFYNEFDLKYLVTNKKFGIGMYNTTDNNIYNEEVNKDFRSGIGLPVVSEIFTANDIGMGYFSNYVDYNLIDNPMVITSYWTMNKNSFYIVNNVGRTNDFKCSSPITSISGVRPTIFLKAGEDNKLIFKSGDGSPNNPYILE